MTRHIVSIYTFLICVCALLSAAAISCDNSKRMETLARVQKTFDKNPELALEMLDSIDPAHLKGKEETAKYGLLKFASLLKAGADVESDSLLLPAIDYYGSSSSPSHEKMLTHFFYAYHLQQKEEKLQAIHEYDKAINAAQSIGNQLYSAMSYSNKGVIYADEYLQEEELACMKQAFSDFIIVNDSSHIPGAYQSLGQAYFHNGMFRESADNHAIAAKLALQASDSVAYADILLNLAATEVCHGNTDKALPLYKEVSESFPEMFKSEDYGFMSEAFLNTGDYENAEKSLQLMGNVLADLIDSIHWYTMRWHLYRNKKDYEAGALMFDSVCATSNQALLNTLKFNLLHEETNYMSQELHTVKKIAAQRKTIIYLVLISLTLLILLIIILYSSAQAKNKHKIAAQKEELNSISSNLKKAIQSMKEKEEMLTSLQTSKEVLLNQLSRLNAELDFLKCSLSNKDNLLAMRTELHDRDKMQWENKLKCLNREKEDFIVKLEHAESNIDKLSKSLLISFRDYYKMASDILGTNQYTYKKGLKELFIVQRSELIKEYSSPKTIAKLDKDINALMEDVIAKIQSEFTLDARDFKILVYSLSGFNYKAIATLMDMNPQTVSSIKSRLIKRILYNESIHTALFRRYLSAGTHTPPQK